MSAILASFDFADFVRMLADHWWSEFRDLGDWPWGTLESIAEYIDLFPIVVCLVWSIYGLNASSVRSGGGNFPRHCPDTPC